MNYGNTQVSQIVYAEHNVSVNLGGIELVGYKEIKHFGLERSDQDGNFDNSEKIQIPEGWKRI